MTPTAATTGAFTFTPTATAGRLGGGLADTNHLDVKGQGFAGQGVVEINGYLGVVNLGYACGHLLPLGRGQADGFALFGVHIGRQFRSLERMRLTVISLPVSI